MNRSRVSIKIALMIGAVEVIAMLILYVIVDLNMTKTLEIQAIDDLNVIAGDRAALVEAYIRDCCSYVEGYSKSCEIRDVLENPENAENIRQAREYTNNYAQDRKSMEGLYVARWDTYVLAHINPDSVDQTFRDEASALELKNMIISNDKPFCTGIVLAPVTKQMIIPVYAPVKDRNGEPIGFVGAAFYVDSLNEELASLSINDVKVWSMPSSMRRPEYTFLTADPMLRERPVRTPILSKLSTASRRKRAARYTVLLPGMRFIHAIT